MPWFGDAAVSFRNVASRTRRVDFSGRSTIGVSPVEEPPRFR
jgi:hypothetical protein